MIGKGARRTADDKTSLNPDARPFRGTFDGNNSTIVGLHIEADGNGDSDDNAYGFFAITDEASISNLAFRDCYVKTGSNTAGIAIGFGRHTDVDNVDVEDSEVYAFQGAGSLAGRLYVYVNGTVTVQNCDISGCIVEATVPASTPEDIKHRYNAGGFVGCLSSGGSDTGKLTKVINNTVTLDGEHYVEAFGFYAGGFVGTTSYAEYSGNTLIIESIDNIKCSYSNGTDNILGYLFSNVDGEILENNKVIINGEEEAITAENNQWKNESLPQIQN